MAYPDSLLADDERVVKHLHPHWITLVRPVLLLIVIVAIGVIGVIALVLVTVVPYLRWRTTHYVLTTHRLMTRVGILSHSGRDIPLNRINNAMYEQSFFERMVNSGTLVVESAGEDGQQVFRNIPNADETQQLINRLVEGDQDRRSRNAARYEARYEARYDADYRDGVPVDDPDQPTRRMERP